MSVILVQQLVILIWSCVYVGCDVSSSISSSTIGIFCMCSDKSHDLGTSTGPGGSLGIW